MNGIGRRIKQHRLKLMMTQTVLSQGIISVSYLSKIENGVAIPPPETIVLLCSRLNIEPRLNDSKEKEYHELCLSWFKHLYYNDRENMILTYSMIKEIIPFIPNANLTTIIEIHKLRYYVLVNRYDKAEIQLQWLSKIAERFSSRERYYWLKFTGYYYFVKSSYHQSFESFKQANQYVASAFYLEEEEKFGLYYMIALSASNVRKLYETLIYSNKALEYYQKNYYLKQCAQCHILIGITCSRLKNYKDAIKSYKLAKTIAENINDNNILATVFQNTGYLYALFDNSNEALKYYLNSYKIRTIPSEKIVPISSMMKLYYQKSDYFNAHKWLELGLKLISENPISLVFVNEFKVYERLLIEDNSSSLEDLILIDMLPSLDEKELFYDKYSYLVILSDYYYKIRRYKSAAYFYKQALEIKKDL